MQVKKGDIVGRYSYNNDILFFVDKIIKVNKEEKNAILKGLNIRIEADAPIKDLKKINARKAEELIRGIDNKFYKQIANNYNKVLECTGKILHLDGDKRYSEKTSKYYKKMGLNAVVRNIAESKQPQMVIPLLSKYSPDILIITGHDSMIKNGKDYLNIYNYRNSKHFINTVINARKWQNSSDKLVIFAGACQSFYEAIMEAGADFASSPGRILIDFIDPLIVAKVVATTEKNVYISAREISKMIKEGEKGVSGIGARGMKKLYYR